MSVNLAVTIVAALAGLSLLCALVIAFMQGMNGLR